MSAFLGGKTMANTYTQLYIHIVFAVKGRQSLIPNTRKPNFTNILPVSSPTKMLEYSGNQKSILFNAPLLRTIPLSINRLNRFRRRFCQDGILKAEVSVWVKVYVVLYENNLFFFSEYCIFIVVYRLYLFFIKTKKNKSYYN